MYFLEATKVIKKVKKEKKKRLVDWTKGLKHTLHGDDEQTNDQVKL